MNNFIKLNKLTLSEWLIVVLPLLLALIVYILFRKVRPDILPDLNLLDSLVNSINKSIPNEIKLNFIFQWFVYSFPDFAWAFSFSYFILLTCLNEQHKVFLIYASIILTIIASIELLQIKYFKGTFDIIDLVSNILGFILGCILTTLKRIKL